MEIILPVPGCINYGWCAGDCSECWKLYKKRKKEKEEEYDKDKR